MCTQKPPHDYSEQLYSRYKEVFHQYIQEQVCTTRGVGDGDGHYASSSHSITHHPCLSSPQVLPSLDGLRHEQLLTALYRRWTNHKVMVRWLSRFFNYLDRCVLMSRHMHGA